MAQQRASGLFGRAQRLVDWVVSPDARKQYYDSISKFSSEQPLLASFLLIQILLSFTPLALFVSFTLGTLARSLIAAILLSLFWIGVALLVLLPALFITVSLGLVVWIWAVTSFVVARWVYNIVPINVRGSGEAEFPNGKKIVLSKTGEGYGDVKGDVVDI